MVIDEPTDRQIEILELIAHSLEDEGIPPTIREIMAALEIVSTNAVADHFRAMAKKGLIERTSYNTARALRITARGWKWLKARKGYSPPAAGRDLAKRVEQAIRMLERSGEPGYQLEVDDVIGVLRGTHKAAA